MKELTSTIGIKGWVQVEVIDHTGKVIESRPPQRNLILDQGLDQIAQRSIVNIFDVAIKGTGATIMKEDVAAPNTYSLNVAGATVSKAAGTRQFTTADEGKLIRATLTGGAFHECRITTLVGASPSNVVNVVQVGNLGLGANYSTRPIVLYSVSETSVPGETGVGTSANSRTSTYGSVPGDNSTTPNNAVVTHKRTFVFDSEDAVPEPRTGSFGWTGTAVTGTGFTANDVGKYIKFDASGEYSPIVTFNSATSVTVLTAPSVTITGATNVTLYGYHTYGSIGFSHDLTVGANANILVRLENGSGVAAPVKVFGANPETPGQQVRVIYTMQVSFGPAAIATGLTANITDLTNTMSNNKNGSAVIESLSNSRVAEDGSADLSYLALEPSEGGTMALSSVKDALNGVVNATPPKDRSPGAAVADMAIGPYVAKQFTRLCIGTFGINDAVNTDPGWFSMGVYDAQAEFFAYTFLFSAASGQKKPGTHALTLRFRKSWNRDLS